MSSPLFRVSMPGTQVAQRRQSQEPWAGFQFWVWPYGWRKTATNVTVVNRGAQANPAASPPFPRDPIPENGAGPMYEQPAPAVMGAGDAPAQEFRGARGSLVWKIPTRDRGGQE